MRLKRSTSPCAVRDALCLIGVRVGSHPPWRRHWRPEFLTGIGVRLVDEALTILAGGIHVVESVFHFLRRRDGPEN